MHGHIPEEALHSRVTMLRTKKLVKDRRAFPVGHVCDSTGHRYVATSYREVWGLLATEGKKRPNIPSDMAYIGGTAKPQVPRCPNVH